MSARLRYGVLLMALVLSLGGNLRAEEARLAVIAAPELEKESSLLTAALSQDGRIKMLERAEIDKVLAEQNLQANGLTLKDSLRVGQLLKASGLVLLEKTAESLTIRVVAVDSGVVLAVFPSPLPLAEIETWSKMQAEKIGQAAAKLTLMGKGAIPVSLLRINSALGGKKNTAIEENLNTLLAIRLIADPTLIVLERARLQDAATEKGFAEEKTSFLNSAWVIDGSMTELESGFSLDLRLQPPGGQGGQQVKVEAPDLGGLVEQANAAILKALQVPVQPWNPAKEAERFFQEAQWAANSGLWEQAARAIEAAVALGENSPEALRWRWKCYDRLSRNVAGAGPAGGFTAGKDNTRPSVSQILQMARSVRLCREALEAAPTSPSRDLHLLKYPQTLNAGENFGKGPTAEGSLLLRAASNLIAAGEKKRPTDGEELEALRELREQMHLLYGAIVKMSPDLVFKPRPADQVPAWSEASVPATGFDPNARPLLNVQIERLENGRLWEEKPEPYFAFIKKCLTSDLLANPRFFQMTLESMGRQAERSAFIERNTTGPEWREAGKILGGEKNLGGQIGGAVALCRTGQPLEGVAIFSGNQKAILEGHLPLDYLTEAFSTGPSVEAVMREVTGESTGDAKSALKDLIVSLLGQGFVPSANVLWKLQTCRFSDRQSTALLAALQKTAAAHTATGSPDRWAMAADALTRKLSKWAGVPGQAQAAQAPLVAPQNVPASATTNIPAKPVATPAMSTPNPETPPPLKVDLGWIVKNYDDPESPGVIRWALPQGEKILLQVEYAESKGWPAKRVFRSVDLPSMKSHVLYRDTAPAASAAGLRRDGPTFATDGEGIYFWNGAGLSYVRGKETRDLKGPELVDPFLWMIEGKLYAVDKAGVILRYDPATGSNEILASQLRRPPQSLLDGEANLQNLKRVYRAADGSIAVVLDNTKVYKYQEAKHDWEAEPGAGPNVGKQLPDAMKDAWDETGSMIGPRTDTYLRDRAREEIKADSSPATDPLTRGKRSAQAQMNPAAKYMGAAVPDEKGMSVVTSQTGVVSKDYLWTLLNELRSQQLWLLKLQPTTGEYACRPLDFSPQYLGSIAQAKRPRGLNTGTQRLIPTAAGVAIYAPNDPVLWFIPAAELTSSSHQ